ncbi:hypothetical protein K443DRAFT_521463 [Laccaria amethystina LaAM-08-1]|jgi:hypothetical protein|uniref:Uncharacterized protein n=1 Tax=Laccaria amethystina LaAM-08-1 TaxID=1095629 RepID=A0A0C9XXQ4_9AGAR|nr:hypothetical protein K443DRAFT_521463 [Laccaria amethystina LaAM-08-1]
MRPQPLKFYASLRNTFKFQIAPHGSWTTTCFDQRPSDSVEEKREGISIVTMA